MAPRILIAGNWKMNGLQADLDEIATLEKAGAQQCDILICPPVTLLPLCAPRFGGGLIKFGGQDCHADKSGAHTGDISAAMLKDAGASYVIVGHSERRQDHGETNAQVKAKAEAALSASLTPIVCVGETKAQREAGKQFDVVKKQLAESTPASREIVIAYEPVWAIGTGLTPSSNDITAMHNFMRDEFGDEGVRLLYGGSVKGSNAAEILALPNVDGALVGGASLKAKDFLLIIRASAC